MNYDELSASNFPNLAGMALTKGFMRHLDSSAGSLPILISTNNSFFVRNQLID